MVGGIRGIQGTKCQFLQMLDADWLPWGSLGSQYNRSLVSNHRLPEARNTHSWLPVILEKRGALPTAAASILAAGGIIKSRYIQSVHALALHRSKPCDPQTPLTQAFFLFPMHN